MDEDQQAEKRRQQHLKELDQLYQELKNQQDSQNSTAKPK